MPKIDYVVSEKVCTACGGCEAICPVGAPRADQLRSEIKHEEDCSNVNLFKEECSYCVDCYACERVCPILDGFPGDDEFDNVRFVKAGRSPIHGQDGGVTSQILKSLFEQGEIDCAFGLARNEKWETEVLLMTQASDVAKTSGTKYNYMPIISGMREIIRDVAQKYDKIAIVGCPCQSHAARLLKENLTDKIKLILGLVCMESFSYENLCQHIIPEMMELNIEDVVKMDFAKGKFVVSTKTGEVKRIPIKDIAALARDGCHHCLDYTSYYADISLGSVGAGDGWNSVVVRTEAGEEYLGKVSDLELTDDVNVDFLKKLADTKHKNNAWNYKEFMERVWAIGYPNRIEHLGYEVPWKREPINIQKYSLQAKSD
ncbi:F420H2 dehydrogenase [Methanosarcinales archaeon ex4572_44]|nr:MAG: F420H2 dehydrogenase [Methanosarcinales archaeon ex4484_138]PHP45234.1 MAG: F420H2 dehydrogenase [Methanosarcinales archaeon ex4572_44]RLG26345.1 MAG: F420H2 dehydrogenase [Methanosarcinales archaeon]RLG28273.1 MAG: F420H2 dehydrogenase [Methanosarcinales archaeon]